MTVRHWHITRDIKPRGECAACDLTWQIMDDAERSMPRVEDTCCGKCSGNTCYVDQITGA